MTKTANGIVVARGSTITITSTAHNMTTNLTAFSDPVPSTCGDIPITRAGNGLVVTATFTAPNGPCRFVAGITFDFQVVDAGDYAIAINTTAPDGTAHVYNDPTAVTPPPYVYRGYTFITE